MKPREALPNAASGNTDIDIDDALDLLNCRRRRYLLHYLWDNDGRADLGEAAEQIAAWENDTEVTAITASERKAVYTSLQQFHLSKLGKFDVIEFDQRDGRIELGTEAENIKCCLDVLSAEPEDEQSTVNVTQFGLVAVAVVALGALLASSGVSLPLVVGSGLGFLVLGYLLARCIS